MKSSRGELAFLLSVANDMRKAKGDAELSDLPDSIPNDVTSCLIANAFNYGCQVEPAVRGREGTIAFKTKEDRNTYLNVLDNNDIYTTEDESYWWEDIDAEDIAFIATLPSMLNNIAIDFDEGKYDQYIEAGTEHHVVEKLNYESIS